MNYIVEIVITHFKDIQHAQEELIVPGIVWFFRFFQYSKQKRFSSLVAKHLDWIFTLKKNKKQF